MTGFQNAEQRGPSVCNVSFNREGKDEMTKASIDLQDLRPARGHSLALRPTRASYRMPAFSHFWIRRMMRRSPTGLSPENLFTKTALCPVPARWTSIR
jgi:hypothetical protein